MFRDMINTFKKMDRIRKRYLGFAVSIFLVFAAIMASIFAFQYDIINKIHATNTRDEIIEIKKDFLEDTVNNEHFAVLPDHTSTSFCLWKRLIS